MVIELTKKLGKIFGYDAELTPWQHLILLTFKEHKFEPLGKKQILETMKAIIQKGTDNSFSEAELKRLKHFDTLHNPNAFHTDINLLIKNAFLERPKIKGEYICHRDLCESKLNFIILKRKYILNDSKKDLLQKSSRHSRGDE